MLFSPSAQALDPCVAFEFYGPKGTEAVFQTFFSRYTDNEDYQNILLDCYDKWKKNKGAVVHQKIGGKFSGAGELEYFFKSHAEFISKGSIAVGEQSKVTEPSFEIYDFLKKYDDVLNQSGHNKYIEYARKRLQTLFDQELSKYTNPTFSNVYSAYQDAIKAFSEDRDEVTPEIETNLKKNMRVSKNIERLLYSTTVIETFILNKTYLYDHFLVQNELFENNLQHFLKFDEFNVRSREILKALNAGSKKFISEPHEIEQILELDPRLPQGELDRGWSWQNTWNSFKKHIRSFEFGYNKVWTERMIGAADLSVFFQQLVTLQSYFLAQEITHTSFYDSIDPNYPILRLLTDKAGMTGTKSIDLLEQFIVFYIAHLKNSAHPEKKIVRLRSFERLHDEIRIALKHKVFDTEQIPALGRIYEQMEYLLEGTEYSSSKVFLFRYRQLIGVDNTQKLINARDLARKKRCPGLFDRLLGK